jgi:hypothetical protein
MKFKFENRFNLILAIGLFSAIAYVLSQSFIPVIFVASTVVFLYYLVNRREISFLDDKIIFKGSRLLRSDFNVGYDSLTVVKIEQIYTTIYANVVFSFQFIINGKERTICLDLDDNSKVQALVALFKAKKIDCLFGDDYVEMISQSEKE